MQSIFELKTKLPYDTDLLEDMRFTAQTLLSGTDVGQFTQVIVLYTAKKNKYGVVIKNACTKEKIDEISLVERLKASNDTEIFYVLCMWADNCIDIISADFRKMLCGLNPKNSESMLFVMTADGVGAIVMSATMK